MHIHDPGTGYTAAIDSNNKLQTYSISVPEASYQSEAFGGAFAVYLKHTTTTSGVNEGLGFLEVPANSTKEIKIQRLILSHRMEEPGWAHWEGHVDADTVTNKGTSFTPINMNRSSNKASVALGYHNGADDMVVTPSDDGGELLGVSNNYYSPNLLIPYNGELVLRPGNTLYLSVKTSVGSVQVRGVIYYYEHEIE